MLVFCINDNWTFVNPIHGPIPIKDNVYTVVEIIDDPLKAFDTFPAPDGSRMLTFIGTKAFRLGECPHSVPGNKSWWASDYFRPCKETDISIFQEMLKDPVKLPALALEG